MQENAPSLNKEIEVMDGFSKFISAFNSAGGKLVEPKENSDSLKILFGANLIENSIDGEIIYMHPIEANLSEQSKFIKYEAGSEEGVALLLLEAFLKDLDIDSLNSFIEDLDVGYLSAESSLSEEELEEIVALVKRADEAVIIVADDIYTHEAVVNIALALATLTKYSNLKVAALKPKFPVSKATSNSLEAELSEPEELPSYDGVVVYNVKGDNLDALLGSKQFAVAAKVKDGEVVNFKIGDIEFEKSFKLDDTLKGTIAVNRVSNLDILSSYRFKRIKINKVGSKNG